MMARGSLASNHDGSPARNPADSWLGARMSPQRHPGAVSVPGQLHLPTTIRHPLSHVHSKGKTTAMPLSIPITTSKLSSGLKIRIPRDLPNLPEAFRKRGAIRSQSTSTSPARPSNKRTHSAMMMEDSSGGNSYISYAVPGEGPRIKIMRKQPSAVGPIPPHLANATNLAIRTAKTPVSASAASSPSTNNSSASQTPATAPAGVATADGLGRVDETVVKHRSQSKAGSSSPNSTPVQFPSPVPSVDSVATMPSSASSPTVDSSKNTNHTHEARPVDGVTRGVSAGSGALFNTPTPAVSVTMNAQAIPEQLSPSSGATEVLDMDHDSLQPIELVRVGMLILNQLLCNTFCKNFINKVPLTVANYHQVIKKPMDLTTIEHKLWKTLHLAGADYGSGASMVALTKAAEFLANDVTEGYTDLQDFERDLRRIYQNATYFNSPTHSIYKEAQSFQNAYINLLTSYRQGTKLLLNEPLPQEAFRPELLSISEPGPLYLFRAHTLREMERKMTDISTDLFACFHQPIFDIANEQIGQLSPEHPRFVRMYINKNRSILAKSRDERFARIALLSDLQVGKPYTVSNSAASSPVSVKSSPGTRGRPTTGAIGGSVSMVRMTAKVLIGKPIGERYDMITVGDLDCPNAWITVACVRALDIDVEVPAKFEKGTLSKMRHEVVAYSSDSKISPEYQRAFADALGLLLPGAGRTGQAPVATGQRSMIPAASTAAAQTATPMTTRALGLGITTPATTSTAAATATSAGKAAQKNNSGNNSTGERTSTATWVDLHDQGSNGQYLVKMRIPSLKIPHRAAPASATASISGAAPSHPLAASMPSTPLLPARVYALSSQVPTTPTSSGSDMESLSAPDRIMLSEQISKRGRKMLQELKVVAKRKKVPYQRWSDIEPTLTVDTAHGLFKRIYHVRGEDGLVVQNFKEMDAESFDQRVREVACLLKLRNLEGVGQIQAIFYNEEDHLVGLSMTKYSYTLKQYATNARRHPTPCQKLSLICDMVSAMCGIHNAGLAHRDLSEVNIMVDEDPNDLLEDLSARPHIKVIDFGKSIFVERDEVVRWSMKEHIPESELSLLPLVVLPPDHGYKLYRSILTLPRNKYDHEALPPVDPRSEDVYSLGVLIWRTFSGKSPWNGAIEDDLKKIRYYVSRDEQIKFQLEREVEGPVSRELLLKCLTAQAETRWTTQELKEWLDRPAVAAELLKEFEALGGGRKKMRKNLD